MNYTCPKKPEDLCDCAARVSEEEAKELLHVLQNLTGGRWELDYTTLSEPEPRTLRVEGTCARCGKTICACFQVEELAKEPLLVGTGEKLRYQLLPRPYRGIAAV